MTIKVTLRITPLRLKPLTWPSTEAFPRVDQAMVWLGTCVPDLARWTAYVIRMTSLGCFALAAWRFAYDLKLAQPFFLSDGVLSHWQTYAALGSASAMLASQCAKLAPEGARRRVLRLDDQASAAVVWQARQFSRPLEQTE
ncbi:MAG: hypothetical protein K2X03_17315 [Bryobacteraceae bacterium]|nr:hypothetical protein [Bryobacteraceae bacterium]